MSQQQVRFVRKERKSRDCVEGPTKERNNQLVLQSVWSQLCGGHEAQALNFHSEESPGARS